VPLPAAAAGAQTWLLKLQIAEPQQQGHAVKVADTVRRQRHLQAQQVGRGGLGLQLALQGSLQQAGRQKAGAEAGAQQLHIQGVGEVAQAAHQGPFETLKPNLQGLGIGGQGRRIPGGHQSPWGGVLQQRIQQRFSLRAKQTCQGIEGISISVRISNISVSISRAAVQLGLLPRLEGLHGQGDQSLPTLDVNRQSGIETDRSRRLAATIPGIGRSIGELIAGLAQLGQPLPLPPLLLLPPFLSDLAGELHQLLHREHAAAAVHQLAEPPMQVSPLFRGQLAVTLGVIAGGQMKAGLLNGVQQALSKHLEVERKIAVERGIAALQLRLEGAELLAHGLDEIDVLDGINLDVILLRGKIGPEGQDAPPMAATSAAKSIFSTSMPSPRLKRTKRRTWMFSPTLPATCFTSSATLIELSLM
jgi:hypothetical protein